MTRKQKAVLSRIIATFIIYITLAVIDHMEILPEWLGLWGKMALYLAPYAPIGWDIVYKALRNIHNGQVFGENFLMTVTTFGTFGVGEYSEAVAVMLFYQVGKLFQGYAVSHPRQSITGLMDIYPEYVNTEENGQLKQVEPSDVQVGDIIMVKAEERIPFDNKIVFGDSVTDTSALTGESVSYRVAEGDGIINGYVDGSDLPRVQVTRESDDSIVAKILELVESASGKKAHMESFITWFARYYTPLVVAGTVLLAVIPSLSFDQPWSEGVRRTCTPLVVSCPCVLVTSVPMNLFSGIGVASRKGMLIKGSNYLEALSEMDIIIFDGAGTLTKGGLRMTEIHAVTGSSVPEASEVPRTRVQMASQSSDEGKCSLLELVTLTKSYSDHLISHPVKGVWGDTTDMNRVSNIQEISGYGVQAEIDGHTVLVSSSKSMKEMNVAYQERMSMSMVVYVALDGVYYGYIIIVDSIKDEAFETIRNLKKIGIRGTVMFTDDEKEVGKAVAAGLGLDEVYTRLLPGDKMAKVEELLAQQTGKRRLTFVGDGTNDAPVLSRVDVGIAMGNMGSDAAIEAAGIALMDDNPTRIADVACISRKTVPIVKQNIVFALGVKAVVLLMGAAGMTSVWEAAFTDVGVSVIAILSAIRALSL